MLLYAHVACLVALKCPDLEPIKFEYYEPEVCPKWWVFLSTVRLTLNVCLIECFTILCFPLMILLHTPPLVDAPTFEKRLRYFHIFDLNLRIN